MKPPRFHVVSGAEHPRQPVLQRELGQTRAVRERKSRRRDKKSVHALARHRHKRCIEILDRSHRLQVGLECEPLAGSLGRLQGGSMRGHGRTIQHADPGRLREGFFEDLERLGGEVGLHHRQPSGVAARARQTRHVPEAGGIGMGSEYDGDRRGRRSRRLRLGRGERKDEIDVHADQFGGVLTQLLDPIRPPELDDDGLAFNVTEVAQAGPQRFDPGRPGSRGAEPQKTNARDLCRLLRAGRERPRRHRATDERDECAPPHVQPLA
jgi:hypothetical protein